MIAGLKRCMLVSSGEKASSDVDGWIPELIPCQGRNVSSIIFWKLQSLLPKFDTFTQRYILEIYELWSEFLMEIVQRKLLFAFRGNFFDFVARKKVFS